MRTNRYVFSLLLNAPPIRIMCALSDESKVLLQLSKQFHPKTGERLTKELDSTRAWVQVKVYERSGIIRTRSRRLQKLNSKLQVDPNKKRKRVPLNPKPKYWQHSRERDGKLKWWQLEYQKKSLKTSNK